MLFQNVYIYCDKMLKNIKKQSKNVYEFKTIKLDGYLNKVQTYLQNMLQRSVNISNYKNFQSVNTVKRALAKMKASIIDVIIKLQKHIKIDWNKLQTKFSSISSEGIKLGSTLLSVEQFTNIMKHTHEEVDNQISIIEKGNVDPKTVESHIKQMEEFVYNSREMYNYLGLQDLYENVDSMLQTYTEFVVEYPDEMEERCNRMKCIYCYCLDNAYENAFADSDCDEDF